MDVRLLAAPGVPVGLPADLPAPLLQPGVVRAVHRRDQAALHALKYDGERRLAPQLGAAIARRWARAGRGWRRARAVPASPDRVRERGYDQAGLLAAEAGRRLGLPVSHAVERTRATIAQFDLDRAGRAANLDGAFRVVAGRQIEVAGRWVILVDDVVTTGATLAACAVALLEAGAAGVSGLAVARER